MPLNNILKLLLIYLYCLTQRVYLQDITHPHIFLIIADDMGWNDVGFHGSNQIPTPNIDSIAYNGIILNKFYTSPSCTPSRAALLTGQYPSRLGLQGIPITAGENLHIPLDVKILPERLKELSYKTHLIGKWHVGAAYKNVTPIGRGFDSHFGYWNGYIGYFNHEAKGGDMTGLDLHSNHEPVWNKRGQYLTEMLTIEAEKVIREHDKSKLLFLMLSHMAGHSGKNGVELEVPDIDANNKMFNYIADDNRRLYAGMIDALDKSVGRIVKVLSEEKILDNSLIIFISDNGAQTTGQHRNWGSNWPLRGLKMTVLEGGVRNIAAMYSPLFKNPKQVNNELIHISDLMPTIFSAAGGDVENLGKIDGINQWPSLVFNKESKRSEALLHIDEVRKCAGYLSEKGRYKLVNGSTLYESYDLYYGEDGLGTNNPIYNINAILNSPANLVIRKNLTRNDILQLRSKAKLNNCRKSMTHSTTCDFHTLCLFDLFEDPCETTNIANKFPDVVDQMSKRLLEFWKRLRPQKPKFIDPRANPAYFNNSWHTWLDNDQEK